MDYIDEFSVGVRLPRCMVTSTDLSSTTNTNQKKRLPTIFILTLTLARRLERRRTLRRHWLFADNADDLNLNRRCMTSLRSTEEKK